MDALLSSTQTVNSFYPFWDFSVANGCVPIISGDEAESQEAIVIAYTQKGLLPQKPNAGVNWIGYLTGKETIDGIDQQIVQSLFANGLSYKPEYSQKDRTVTLEIVKM